MLTPAFEIQQTDDFVCVVIRAPFASLSDSEFYVDEHDFKFYAKPYFLRLTFPGPLLEDGRETVTYDADTARFKIHVPKANPGEYFPDLDLQTKLLAPTGGTSARQPVIEVLDGDSETCSAEGDDDDDDDDSVAWQVEQEPYREHELSTDGPKYGFANKRCGVLKRLQTELNEVIDLKEADSISIPERRVLRIADEDDHFSKDHYWADMFESEEIEHFIQYCTKWSDEVKKDGHLEFTEYEKEILLKLPRKEYLLDAAESRCALFGLVDILFAYAYDMRTTEEENTVESGWTISKLSSTLSWFETFTNPKDVTLACYRRSLCYPLYRNWQLTERVWKDVLEILTIGRRMVLKCLIDVRRLFIETGDMRYIFNDLYVDDYCTWIQLVSDKKLSSLVDAMKEVTLTKDDVGFELNSLELAGRLAMNDADSKDRHDSDADTLTNESSSSEFDDSDDDSSSSSSYTESSSASDESATGSSSSATSEDEDECSDDDTRVRDPGAGKTLISVLTEEVSCESSTVVDLTDAATGDKGTDSLHEQFVSLTVGNDSASPRTNEGGVQVPCNQESCESSNFVDLTDAATDDKDTDSLHEQFVSLTVGNDSASPRTNEGGVQVPCNPE